MTNSLADIVGKATGSPWQSQHDFDLSGELTIVGNVDGEIIDGHTHHTYTTVAEVYDNENLSEDRANAQLIALAPTLATLVLEAREALQKWLVYDGHDAEAFSGVRPMLDYAEAIEATRATLAKLESLQ